MNQHQHNHNSSSSLLTPPLTSNKTTHFITNTTHITHNSSHINREYRPFLDSLWKSLLNNKIYKLRNVLLQQTKTTSTSSWNVSHTKEQEGLISASKKIQITLTVGIRHSPHHFKTETLRPENHAHAARRHNSGVVRKFNTYKLLCDLLALQTTDELLSCWLVIVCIYCCCLWWIPLTVTTS